MFRARLRKVTSNDFIRHNLIFFTGSMGVAFLNYIYYPIMGRLLPNVSFGELQVLLSTYSQLAIILSVLSLIAINIYVNEKDRAKAHSTVVELEKITLYGAFGLFAVIALLSPVLQSALKFSSPLPFVAIGLAFVFTVPSTFRNAYLQSQSNFGSATLNSLIGSVSKLLFSSLLILLALQALGGILGFALAQLVSLLFVSYQAKRFGYAAKTSSRKIDFRILRPILPYGLFVLGMSLLTTLQVSIDVTLVKFYLSPEIAGHYAAIATVARIIYFLTGSFVVVMLSSLSITKSDEENLRSLRSTGLIILGLGGLTLIVFSIFPTLIISILLGARYVDLANLLPLLSFSIFTTSLLNLLVTYYTALRRLMALPLLALGSLVTILYVILSVKSPEHIIQGLLYGSSVSLITIAILLITDLLRSHRHIS